MDFSRGSRECRAVSPILRWIISAICRRSAVNAFSGNLARSAGRGPKKTATPNSRRSPGFLLCCWSGAAAARSRMSTECPAGYMLFAPPQYVPRSIAFPTSPVSADAVLLMTAHLLSEFAGGGIGRMLVQTMAKDLTRRGVKAIEAFGDRRWESPACMLPVDYLLARGVQDHPPASPLPPAADGTADRPDLAGRCRSGARAPARLDDPGRDPGRAAARLTRCEHRGP